MYDIQNELMKKEILFPLECYDIKDLGTLADVQTVLENRQIFTEIVASVCFIGMETITDFLNYLYLKKLNSFEHIVEFLKHSEDKAVIRAIANSAGEKCESVNNGLLVRFVNQHYPEIFDVKYDKLALYRITLSLITPLLSGIKKEVFEHLAQKYNYLLLDRFGDFQRYFEQNPELFGKLFHQGNLMEVRQLQFSRVFPVFLFIWRKKETPLRTIIEPIIEKMVEETEELMQCESAMDAQNLLRTDATFRQVYDFMIQIQHPKGNRFRRYYQQMQERVSKYLQEHGKKVSYSIPIGKIVQRIKTLPSKEKRMIMLSHDVGQREDGSIGYKSRLSIPSRGKQSLIDFVRSNIPSDEYFTYTHQTELDGVLSFGSAIISMVWHDETLFPELIQWYVDALNNIEKHTTCSEKLADDIQTLDIMLQLALESEKNENLRPVCYGALMFLCAMMEKLLRAFYVYLLQDEKFVLFSSATLGTLLDGEQSILVNVFGKDHLRSIGYFLGTVGKKKIGRNIRNSLAHWISMSREDLCSTKVAQLAYFYTDILNTVLLYIHGLLKDENE